MRVSTLLNGRVLTALVMLAIFAAMSLMALGFPEKARLMPLLFGIPGSALALGAVFLETRAAARERAPAGGEPRHAPRGERQMLFWMLAFFVGILAFGFVYAAPLLVFAFLRFGKNESLIAALVGAAGTWAVLYGLFELTFQIPLFNGHAIEWLRR